MNTDNKNATTPLETALDEAFEGAVPGEVPATAKTPKPRGFAAISPERRREISSRGGKAAHVAGTAHRFDTAEAAP